MAIILDIELFSSSVYLIEAIATTIIGKADAHHAMENLSNRKQNIQKRNKNIAPVRTEEPPQKLNIRRNLCIFYLDPAKNIMRTTCLNKQQQPQWALHRHEIQDANYNKQLRTHHRCKRKRDRKYGIFEVGPKVPEMASHATLEVLGAAKNRKKVG